MPEEIYDIITLAKIIYSIYSGDIDYIEILKLTSKVVKLGLFGSLQVLIISGKKIKFLSVFG